MILDSMTGGLRAMDKYLDQMSDIRLLQDRIVGHAERHAVPVIESTSIEHATAALLDLILARAEPLVRAL